MLKRKLATVVITGLFLGAGASQASVFPSAAQEFSASLYADGSRPAMHSANAGATGSVFPTAAKEHGPVREYVDVRPAGITPSIARGSSVFPSSVNETGSVL